MAATAVTLSFFAQPGGAQTTRTLTVTPHTGLVSGDVVTVTGNGFTPGGFNGMCEAVISSTPSVGDCDSGATLVFVDGNGTFSNQFTIKRFLTIGNLTIDCATPGAGCVIAAAEANDIPNTLVSVPLSFAPVTGVPRPDLIFKRRDTGQLFEDNQYFKFVSDAPQHNHAIAAGGTWTYALQVQNDGTAPDNLTITANPLAAPFGVRFFFGYFDMTAAVTGGGLTFHGVAPGQVLKIAVDLRADPAVTEGSGVLESVRVSSAAAPELVDYARLWVGVPSIP